MKTLMVGTCGHIDHGKTSLIKALTGVDTDRLKEEKERGITIDLGFTSLKLGSNKRVSFIDVPGHEKFIKNMIAGITGVNTVLFVISADEGIMPQTIEHLEIINSLGIKKGIIAITKCDRGKEFLPLIYDDIKNIFKGTTLEGIRIIETSIKDNEGIEEIKDFLKEKSLYEEDLKEHSPFRMAVDRVFTVSGVGTVVTGTISEGVIKEGEVLTLYGKDNRKVKVRGIEAYGEKVNTLGAKNRCALNLQGIDKRNIKRGDVLSSDEDLKPSFIVDCSFDFSNDKRLKNRQRIRFYHGTKEVMGRVYIISESYLQFRLEEEIVSKKGDYYYIRNFSPMYNLGGGKIIDSNPNKAKGNLDKYKEKLLIKEKGSLEDNILELLNSREFLYLNELKEKLSFEEKDIEKNLKTLEYYGKITIIKNCKEKIIISRKSIGIIKENLEALLLKFHKENPLKKGITKEELRKKLTIKEIEKRDFNYFYELVSDDEKFELKGEYISLKGFKRRLNLDEKNFKRDLFKELSNGLVNVNKKDLMIKYNISEKKYNTLINIFEEDGELVLLSDEVLIKTDIFNDALEKIKSYFKDNMELTLKECRDILLTNRKIALAFLEELDCRKITKRIENIRVLL